MADSKKPESTPTPKPGRKPDGKVVVRARISEATLAKLEDYRWANRYESATEAYGAVLEQFFADQVG